MPDDPNVVLLEDVYAAWARGDFTRNDMFVADVEFVTDFPERMTYHGHEGVQHGWFDFLSAWDDFRVDPERILPAGEDRYVVLVHLSGLGKESRVPIEGAGANLVVMRDGRIAYFELVWDREQALAWGGLEKGDEPGEGG
jgi:ketosteroid isomerase-like protein